MSNKALILGLSLVLLASSVVAAFEAQAAWYPYGLSCVPSSQMISSGERVTFSARYAYDHDRPQSELTWTAVGGHPDNGTGNTFRTRFTTSSINETRVVTVTDGYQTASCVVYVYGPQPTPTPTVVPSTDALSVTLAGRNVTRGQSGEHSTVSARAGNTVEFILRVRSNASRTLSNVWVTDYLPVGMTAIANTTALNGYLVGDGITSAGLNIDSLAPGQESVIRFSVLVDGTAVPALGQVSSTNYAQVRADGASPAGASMKVTFGIVPSLLTASGVKTGPFDSMLLALAVASLATGLYAAYTRTGAFGRRMMTAEIARASGKALNFVQ